ncbi:Alpha-1,3/1,6-mannosyltransferase ALG2-like protein [Drosera capensis]
MESVIRCEGGAERLIVDAAMDLVSHGHKVHVFTSHHDRSRCFEETLSGAFPVTVYGDFLPRHIFYRLHAVVFCCHFPDLLLAKHTTTLRRIYRKPIDYIEERTTGMADLIVVNSKFTASTFARTFKYLNDNGIRPPILYPAVNVDQFDEPDATK